MDHSPNLITEKRLAKNVVYNLLGYGIPLIFAIIFIPFLIKGLGDEKFGILNLAWIVIGYFSFLDFGIGRALTKITAEKIGLYKFGEIPALFWTSLILLFIISLIFTLILILLTPTLVTYFFTISTELHSETINAFYLLALSVPVVTTTAGIRGLLEAYQKFGIINIIRIILGGFTFLGPILCLFYTNNLLWIMLVLLAARVIVWLLYFQQALKLKINLNTRIRNYFSTSLVKQILILGGWITVSNIVVPVLTYLDRFLIGSLVSASAITYYATPYEVVSKLLLVPSAITGVLFPVFSANYLSNPDYTEKLSLKAVKYIFIFLFPLILIIITFSYESMNMWLGTKFASNSSTILKLFAVGILFNSLAYVPFSFFQGIGKPDIIAKLQLIELPIYLMVLWFGIKHYGIQGAAYIWLLRIVLDTAILFLLSRKEALNKLSISFSRNSVWAIVLGVLSFSPLLFDSLYLKIIMLLIVLIIFSYLTWKFLLEINEQKLIVSHVRKIFINKK